LLGAPDCPRSLITAMMEAATTRIPVSRPFSTLAHHRRIRGEYQADRQSETLLVLLVGVF
jgi:hypothetical protein